MGAMGAFAPVLLQQWGKGGGGGALPPLKTDV